MAKASQKTTRKTAKKNAPRNTKKTVRKAAKKTTGKASGKTAKKTVKKAAGVARKPPQTTVKKKTRTRAKTSPATAGKKSVGRMFPGDFLWGTATAAQQVDGGDSASDWYEFCKSSGRIADGSSSYTGCDHWYRYEEDFKLMKSMGVNAYRLGLDWSRFEPTPGHFDTNAVLHFRDMLGSLQAKGIRPLLTLNHFAIPGWWLARGGWTEEKNLPDFYKFIEYIVPEIGDLVREFIIINEPNVYAYMAYIEGKFPPARKGLIGYFQSQRVQKNMLLAHFHIYDYIHNQYGKLGYARPEISSAINCLCFDPADPENEKDQDRVRKIDYRYNYVFADGLQSGTIPAPLGKGEKIHDGGAWEFFGLNYYSRQKIRFDWSAVGTLFIKPEPPGEGVQTTDMGWEVYPEGLTRIIGEINRRYDLPIRVTENGVATEHDSLRRQYLTAHLRALHQSMSLGARVEGYYHWSFLDNFEWAEGYTPRFGLVNVDYSNMRRTIKESGKLYGKIIKTGNL